METDMYVYTSSTRVGLLLIQEDIQTMLIYDDIVTKGKKRKKGKKEVERGKKKRKSRGEKKKADGGVG